METKDGAHSAVTLSLFFCSDGNQDWMKSFGWVYLIFVSLTLKLTCSPGFWNQTCRFIDGFPGTCSYWSTLCSTFLMPLFISCRSLLWFACEGICLGRPLSASPSLSPSSLHILSLPVPSITSTWALPCLGASVCSQREEQRWKPHTDQKALHKCTESSSVL